MLARGTRESDAQIARDGKHSRVFTVPGDALDALAQVFGEKADQVRVVEHSRHWTFLHRGFSATTRRNLILLRGSGEHFLRQPELVLEEYFHVLRQWNTGALTRRRYLLEWVRRGYARNRFEVEAKAFAVARAGTLRRAAGDPAR